MGIDDMGADRQFRVIFKQSVQDVECFAFGTRNDLRIEDTVLIREMGVDTDDPVVIPEVPRVKGRQQRTFPYPKALAI